jgi:hypothetical protein
MTQPSKKRLLTLNQFGSEEYEVKRLVGRYSIDFGTEQSPNERIKLVTRIRPNIRANNGTVVYVRVGSQQKLSDQISWTKQIPFTVGSTRDLCVRVSGRYISWEIYSLFQWDLESIDVEVKVGAMW